MSRLTHLNLIMFYFKVKENQLINVSKFRSYLHDWYKFNKLTMDQCKKVGNKFCLLIRYEDFVLHSESTLRHIMEFLDEEWSEKLLRHQDFIGTDVTISKSEWSSQQIVSFTYFFITFILSFKNNYVQIEPINLKSLNGWRKKLKSKLNIQQIDILYVKKLLKRLNYTKLQSYTQKKESFVRDKLKSFVNSSKTIHENTNKKNYYF